MMLLAYALDAVSSTDSVSSNALLLAVIAAASGICSALLTHFLPQLLEYWNQKRVTDLDLVRAGQTLGINKAGFEDLVSKLKNIEESHADCKKLMDSFHSRIQEAITGREELRSEVAALKSRVAHLEALAATARIVVNREGLIVDANEDCVPLLGWDPQDLHGKDVSVLIPYQFRAAHTAAFDKAVVTDSVPNSLREVVALRRNGEQIRIWIALSKFEMLGEPAYLAVIRRAG